MARKQSRGICTFCGLEAAKGPMLRHLESCPARKEAVGAADAKVGARDRIYHLRVQDAYGGTYWLDLEMRGSAPLKELDRYLRHIWLECCGHLSEFSIGAWTGNEIPMSRKADTVFKSGVEVTHIYDFGTSSETLIRPISVRTGGPLTDRPIHLMARNVLPGTTCMECDEPATWICMECIVEEEETGALCDEHVETHEHDAYGEPLPLVNSPRCGMCGYEGPAEAPY